MAAAVGSAAPNHAAAATGIPPLPGNDFDVRWLQKRLEMVTEWHERAEDMLAKIQSLPNHARRLRHFTENPDIAIPLLENYDAAILEKEEQIQELQRQLQSARAVVERAEADGTTASRNARVAEERAHVAIEEANVRLQNALAEVAQQKAAISQLQNELVAARDAASTVVGCETTLRSELKRAEQAVADRDADIHRLRARVDELEVQLETAAKRIRTQQQSDATTRNDNEAAKIQLHMVQKENDDKVHEIERLRNKMVAALKQSAENHEHHLRLVEERHRQAIEQLREESRTHEVTIMKLRAQLAHADISGSGGSGNGGNGTGAMTVAGIPSASEVLATQAHRAQEAELRRLQGEVVSLRMQRDDATFRLEQAQAAQRTDADAKVLEARKDAELLRIRVHELEDRCARLTTEAQAAREAARQERDRSRALAVDQSAHAAQREQLTKKLEEARKAQASAEEALERARTEAHDALEAERKQARASERRAEDARRGEQVAKDKHAADIADLQRSVELLRTQAREAQAKVVALTAAINDKERAVETLTVKSDRLSQGLAAHKQQLAAADERLKRAVAVEAAAHDELRKLTLHCEHLRMENARLAADRDRLARDSDAMHSALRGGR